MKTGPESGGDTQIWTTHFSYVCGFFSALLWNTSPELKLQIIALFPDPCGASLAGYCRYGLEEDTGIRCDENDAFEKTFLSAVVPACQRRLSSELHGAVSPEIFLF